MSKKIKVKRLKDFECDWYWIPEDKIEKFNQDSETLEGMEYMDNPELFESFSADYGHYATGGAPDLVPFEFEKKEVEFL